MPSTTDRLVVHVPSQEVLPSQYTSNELSRTLNAGLLHQRYAGLPRTDSRSSSSVQATPDSELLIRALVTAFRQQQEHGQARLEEGLSRLERHAPPGLDCISRDITLESPLALGIGYDHPLENGMLFHHTLGVPYLPGTSVKGLMRSWVNLLDANDVSLALFGSETGDDPEPGVLLVWDALPTRWPALVTDIVNCHLPAYYSDDQETTWPNPGAVPREDPRPVKFLAVEPGTSFRFRVAAPKSSDVKLDAALSVLGDALALLGIGAKTAAGYGRVGVFEGDEYADPNSVIPRGL